jgi:hypothetical protein
LLTDAQLFAGQTRFQRPVSTAAGRIKRRIQGLKNLIAADS